MCLANQTSPRFFRRHRLQIIRRHLVFAIVLAGIVYPVWMLFFANFWKRDNDSMTGRRIITEDNWRLLWLFVFWEWAIVHEANSATCLVFTPTSKNLAEHFSLSNTTGCAATVDTIVMITLVQAVALFLLANVCLVILCQLHTGQSSKFASKDVSSDNASHEQAGSVNRFPADSSMSQADYKSPWEQVCELASDLCVQSLAPCVAGAGLVLLLPTVNMLSTGPVEIWAVAGPCFCAPFLSASLVHYLQRNEIDALFVFEKLHSSDSPSSSMASTYDTKGDKRCPSTRCLITGSQKDAVSELSDFMRGLCLRFHLCNHFQPSLIPLLCAWQLKKSFPHTSTRMKRLGSRQCD